MHYTLQRKELVQQISKVKIHMVIFFSMAKPKTSGGIKS